MLLRFLEKIIFWFFLNFLQIFIKKCKSTLPHCISALRITTCTWHEYLKKCDWWLISELRYFHQATVFWVQLATVNEKQSTEYSLWIRNRAPSTVCEWETEHRVQFVAMVNEKQSTEYTSWTRNRAPNTVRGDGERETEHHPVVRGNVERETEHQTQTKNVTKDH